MSRSLPASDEHLRYWAAERRHANLAYQRWCEARFSDKSLAYAAYLAASDREDAAAAAVLGSAAC